MKKFITIFFAVFISMIISACGTPAVRESSEEVIEQPRVINSHPNTLVQATDQGIKLEGDGEAVDSVIPINVDGRYRVSWDVPSPKGGTMALMNKDQDAPAMFKRVIIFNLVQPSNGELDIALTAGEYELQTIGIDGIWSLSVILVEEMDL